jgi:hypothetical protein
VRSTRGRARSRPGPGRRGVLSTLSGHGDDEHGDRGLTAT